MRFRSSRGQDPDERCEFRILIDGRDTRYDLGDHPVDSPASGSVISDSEVQLLVQTEPPATTISVVELSREISPDVVFPYFARQLVCPGMVLPWVMDEKYKLRALSAGIVSGSCANGAIIEEWSVASVDALASARKEPCAILASRTGYVAMLYREVKEVLARNGRERARFEPSVQRAFLQNAYASSYCGKTIEDEVLGYLPGPLKELYAQVVWGSSKGPADVISTILTTSSGVAQNASGPAQVKDVISYCSEMYPSWNSRNMEKGDVVPGQLPPGCYRIATLGQGKTRIAVRDDPFDAYGTILIGDGGIVEIGPRTHLEDDYKPGVRMASSSVAILALRNVWTGGQLPLPVISFPVVYGVADAGRLPTEFIAFHFVERKDYQELARKFASSPVEGNVNLLLTVREPVSRELVLSLLENDSSEIDLARIRDMTGASNSGRPGVPLRLLATPDSLCRSLYEAQIRQREIVLPESWDGLLTAEDKADKASFCASLPDAQCFSRVVSYFRCAGGKSGLAAPSDASLFRGWKINGAKAALE